MPPSASSTVDVNANGSGTYTVKLVNGSCSNTSSVGVNVTITAGTASTVTPNPVTPVCLGGTLSLSLNDVGATAYVWTGPNAFTATTTGSSPATKTNFQDIGCR